MQSCVAAFVRPFVAYLIALLVLAGGQIFASVADARDNAKCTRCATTANVVTALSGDLAKRERELSRAWSTVRTIDASLKRLRASKVRNERAVSRALRERRDNQDRAALPSIERRLRRLSEETSRLDSDIAQADAGKKAQFAQVSWLNNTIALLQGELTALRGDLRNCNDQCLSNGARITSVDFGRVADMALPELTTDCTQCGDSVREANAVAGRIRTERRALKRSRSVLSASEKLLREADEKRNAILTRRLQLLRAVASFDKRDQAKVITVDLDEAEAEVRSIAPGIRRLLERRKAQSEDVRRIADLISGRLDDYEQSKQNLRTCEKVCVIEEDEPASTVEEPERVATDDGERGGQGRAAIPTPGSGSNGRGKAQDRLTGKPAVSGKADDRLASPPGLAATETDRREHDVAAGPPVTEQPEPVAQEPEETVAAEPEEAAIAEPEPPVVRQVDARRPRISEPVDLDDDGPEIDEAVARQRRRPMRSAGVRPSPVRRVPPPARVERGEMLDPIDPIDLMDPFVRPNASLSVGWGRTRLPNSRFLRRRPAGGGSATAIDKDRALDVWSVEVTGQTDASVVGGPGTLADWEVRVTFGSDDNRLASQAAFAGMLDVPSPAGTVLSFAAAGNDLSGLRHDVDYSDVRGLVRLGRGEQFCGIDATCGVGLLAGLQLTRTEERFSGALAAGTTGFGYDNELSSYSLLGGIWGRFRQNLGVIGDIPLAFVLSADAYLKAGVARGDSNLVVAGVGNFSSEESQAYLGLGGEIAAVLELDLDGGRLALGGRLGIESEPTLGVQPNGGLDISLDDRTTAVIFLRGTIDF